MQLRMDFLKLQKKILNYREAYVLKGRYRDSLWEVFSVSKTQKYEEIGTGPKVEDAASEGLSWVHQEHCHETMSNVEFAQVTLGTASREQPCP